MEGLKLDDKTMELIAVGASITAGCQSCLEYHAGKAMQNGATEDEVVQAIAVAKMVRGGGAKEMDRFVDDFVDLAATAGGRASAPEPSGCDCGGACC